MPVSARRGRPGAGNRHLGRGDELGVEIDDRETAAGIKSPRVKLGTDWCETDAMIDRIAERYAGAYLPVEIATAKAALAQRREEFETECRKHGIAALIARREALDTAIDAVLAEIDARPIVCAEDLAVRFDAAVEYELNDAEHQWPRLFDVMRGLAAMAPGFTFTAIRRNPHESRTIDAAGIPTGPNFGHQMPGD